ncbi:unnamed protein product [Notodromas monacha]|uniref:Uncharacterized protein n=1 Tax=Notodromas monacha TaxID=399045 RepID=A0A7R9BY55_9CRUS|nr:unnamed protein product [Notodromas monacha]CAG0923823.1 unnamed protein product [Notodromas monacha]
MWFIFLKVMWKILLKIVGIASLCACSPLVKVKTSPHASFSSSSATVYSNGCCGQNGKLLVHKHEHKHKHVHKHLKAVNNNKQIPMKKDHFDFGDFNWQDFDFNDFPFELSSLGHEQKTGKKITPGSKEARSPSVANPWSYRGNNLGWNLGYLGSHSSSSYSSSSKAAPLRSNATSRGGRREPWKRANTGGTRTPDGLAPQTHVCKTRWNQVHVEDDDKAEVIGRGIGARKEGAF